LTQPVELSEVIGGYVLERVVGRGGMGTVYLGKHKLLGRPAAVKVLEPELAGNDQVISRFFHEAKIVNDVRHPNIVDVIDFVRTENPRRVAFIMEYLEGDSLDRFLKEIGPLPVMPALNVVAQILEGLAAVHAIGVIHRDLKPANLRFTTKVIGDGSSIPIIKILDFGIAKASGPMVAHKTQTGLVMGTPAYMAPEQVSGEAVSAASDVYAIGEILYELLGGRRMFSGTNTEVLRAKLAPQPPPIELPQGLPHREELVSIIWRCVAFEAARRPSTDELLASLAALRPRLHGAVSRDFEDAAKPTTLIPVATPAPVRARGSLPTPAPVKPPPAARTGAPVAEPPQAMNTLAAERSLLGAEPKRPRSLMPLAAGVALLSVATLAVSFLTQSPEPIVVHTIPADPEPVEELAPVEPPPPAVLEAEPAVEPERDPEPIKKSKKRRVKAREPRSIKPRPPEKAPLAIVPKATEPPRVEPPAPPPPAQASFGRIKVTAWTTAGRQVPATVKIDGRAVGRTAPLEIKARAGKRKVEVEAVGHPAKIQEIEVKDGETATIDVVVDLR
jgi:serine/threonine-protein kinase